MTIRGIPEGSILDLLLCNLFINDLFLFVERTNICNFADDNTICRCDTELEVVLEDLQHDMIIFLSWFKIRNQKGKILNSPSIILSFSNTLDSPSILISFSNTRNKR